MIFQNSPAGRGFYPFPEHFWKGFNPSITAVILLHFPPLALPHEGSESPFGNIPEQDTILFRQ